MRFSTRDQIRTNNSLFVGWKVPDGPFACRTYGLSEKESIDIPEVLEILSNGSNGCKTYDKDWLERLKMRVGQIPLTHTGENAREKRLYSGYRTSFILKSGRILAMYGEIPQTFTDFRDISAKGIPSRLSNLPFSEVERCANI